MSPTCHSICWHDFSKECSKWQAQTYGHVILMYRLRMRKNCELLMSSLTLLLSQIWIIIQWQPDGQKAMHMSPPCNMHRWAQKLDVRSFSRLSEWKSRIIYQYSEKCNDHGITCKNTLLLTSTDNPINSAWHALRNSVLSFGFLRPWFHGVSCRKSL